MTGKKVIYVIIAIAMLTTAVGSGFVYWKHQKELQKVELQKKMDTEKEKEYLYHANKMIVDAREILAATGMILMDYSVSTTQSGNVYDAQMNLRKCKSGEAIDWRIEHYKVYFSKLDDLKKAMQVHWGSMVIPPEKYALWSDTFNDMYNESCSLIELCKSPFEPGFLDYKDRINQLNNAIVFMDNRISSADAIHPDISVGLDEIRESFSKVTEGQ